jgi:hypothetical protein
MGPGGRGYEADSPHDDDVAAHDVPVDSFKDDVRRKLSIRRVMPGGAGQDMKAQPDGQKSEALKRLARRVEVTLKRTKDPRLIKVLKGMRSAATMLQSEATSAGTLSPLQRKRAEKLLTTYSRAAKKLDPRGWGLGNSTSNVPRGLQSDGASGEISKLMKDTETDFAGRPSGMRPGADLYESGDEVFGTDSPEMGDAAPPGGMLTKEETNYRYASDALKSCGNCKHFVEPAGCRLVMGMILKTNVCDRFAPEGGKSMSESVDIRVREAVAAFRRNDGQSEGDRREARVKRTLARELRRARSEAERRAATRKYKAAMRELEGEGWSRVRREDADESEGSFKPLPKHNPDDYRRDAADAGDE